MMLNPKQTTALGLIIFALVILALSGTLPLMQNGPFQLFSGQYTWPDLLHISEQSYLSKEKTFTMKGEPLTWNYLFKIDTKTGETWVWKAIVGAKDFEQFGGVPGRWIKVEDRQLPESQEG